MDIPDNAILQIINLPDNLLLKLPGLPVLILPELLLPSNLLSLICLPELILPLPHLLRILPDVLLLVLVHVLEAAVVASILLRFGVHLSLVLLEDLVHYLLPVFLVLPSVGPGVTPVVAWWVLWGWVLVRGLAVAVTVGLVGIGVFVTLVGVVSWWWAWWVGSRLVVLFFYCGFAEHLISLVELLEFFLITCGWVWMKLLSHFSEWLFYLFLICW